MADKKARLIGKTALITAATQGIGRATAYAFAAEDAQVFATDINNDEMLAELEDEGMTVFKLDVTGDTAIVALLAEIGTLDVLFNCAGTVHNGTHFAM